MKQTNGVCLLGRQDLTNEGKLKKIKNIEYTDITRNLEGFLMSRLVIFVDDDKMKMKILKSKYKIIQ